MPPLATCHTRRSNAITAKPISTTNCIIADEKMKFKKNLSLRTNPCSLTDVHMFMLNAGIMTV